MSGPTNPVGVSETLPTTFTDGTAIPSGTITSIDYGYGTASGTYSRVVNDTTMKLAGGKIAATIPTDLAFGTWFVAARTRTKDGAVSQWGNELSFTIAPKQPNPITDFGFA